MFNYGPPKDLLSDNGGCFTAKFFQDVCQILNVHNSFTTTYHAQANGQVERYNRTIKAAIRSYLADHPKDWDLYSSALTFAYNCQPHSSTALAPFELVLSRPPPPLAIRAQPAPARTPRETRDTWKSWLEKALREAKGKLEQAQARYKRNYDARLRRQNEKIEPDNWFYLRVERRDEREHRHKLAAVAEGPYKVLDIRGSTVVIERQDKSIEIVSRSRVVLAPQPRITQEIQDSTRPMTDEELTPTTYPASEEINNQDINMEGGNETTTTDGNNPEEQDSETQTNQGEEEINQPSEQQGDGSRQTEEPEEFVIDRIISHEQNNDAEHPHAAFDETLYRVRWYGYQAADDTWEPITHLPRSKVISYHKRKRLAIPDDIQRSMTG